MICIRRRWGDELGGVGAGFLARADLPAGCFFDVVQCSQAPNPLAALVGPR